MYYGREFKYGEVYYIRKPLNYSTDGCVQESGRPAVIVSNDIGNTHSEIVEVAYLTTQEKAKLPTHVHIPEGRGFRESTILCEQIQTISQSRIGDYVGTLSNEQISQLQIACAISLNIAIDASASPNMESQLKESFQNFDALLKQYRELQAERKEWMQELDTLREMLAERNSELDKVTHAWQKAVQRAEVWENAHYSIVQTLVQLGREQRAG